MKIRVHTMTDAVRPEGLSRFDLTTFVRTRWTQICEYANWDTTRNQPPANKQLSSAISTLRVDKFLMLETSTLVFLFAI